MTSIQNRTTSPRKDGHAVVRLMLAAMLAFFPGSSMLMAGDEEKAGAGMVLGEPFWRSKAMDREPVLFIQEEGNSLATAKLLFIPSAKFRITHPDQVMQYEEGKDFTWKPGSNII